MLKTKIFIIMLVFLLLFSSAYSEEVNISTTKIVGVRSSGEKTEGVVANLTVQVKHGTGHVFIDTIPLTQIDTQASARLAKEVACETLNVKCDNLDFFYIIYSDFPMVGGPSAGAALTAATIAALQNVSMNQDVFITGTINPGGSIGPIAGIAEKAEAAHNAGAKIFLIPEGQSIVDINGTEIDLAKKAQKEWGMRIIEVSQITDAYKYLTGFELQKKKVASEEIASQKFNDAMKSMSENLIKDAQEEYDEVSQKIAVSTLSFQYLDPIKEKFKQSELNLKEAQNYYNSKQYYSAASLAVRSLINTGYVDLLLGYYDSKESPDYVTEQYNKAKTDINAFEIMFLKNKKLDSIEDIEAYTVVIDRIREGEDILNDSYTALSKGEYDSALYLISFAEVRKNTAYYWLTLTNEFKGNLSFTFNQSAMRQLAQERIQQSSNYIVYSQTVANNNILESAKSHLSKAENAFDQGKYVFAIFEAAKARAEANLAMELRAATNKTVENLLNSYTDSARLSIKNAEEQGLLPILALSYLEYAKTFEKSDPLTSLIYLSYSKEMSKISVDIVHAATKNILPEQPVTTTKYYESAVKVNTQTQIAQQFVLMLSSALAGALAVFFIFEQIKKH